KRKETIERVFADLKHKHGLRWTTLRGKKKLSMQAMLVFAAMNLKKLANWTWKGPTRQPIRPKNRINWTKIGRIIKIRLFCQQSEIACREQAIFFYYFPMNCCVQMLPDST
ncbi:transposase, partial [Bacillus sp. C28GYM-DRY-1]|uniref:transposase n=1 Tax=Bacillus sp. C28GYM-DRY-1 TaxID=3062686 RepID=UPI0026770CF6